MFNVQLTTDTTLYVSQIIDNLHDLAQYFGADTEEMVNYAQRHFKSSHRQREWLTVRAMLRHALGPDASIEYEESGKPILKFNAQLRDSRERQSSMFNVQCSMFNGQLQSSRENLHLLSAKPVQILQASSRAKRQCSMVSISHSKSHAALLLSSHRNIGVDIEQISERILRLADRIAQPDELPSNWQSLTPEQQARHLTTLWTIKEALYKSLDHQDGIDLLKLPISSNFKSQISNFKVIPHAGNIIAVVIPAP
ncbi:MAG: 4'-phosphopantetheinyl transferase superfamily protein [Bacteroidaceae bacterium]|nr:4'-phosphopantetheinyl transferase superfamily protein [Bacteroidaceae bacterium]